MIGILRGGVPSLKSIVNDPFDAIPEGELTEATTLQLPFVSGSKVTSSGIDDSAFETGMFLYELSLQVSLNSVTRPPSRSPTDEYNSAIGVANTGWGTVA